ncbi:hypothetical protein WJX74_009608 [Apatococcus lobatus]|uniref:Uncharacterized protein n=1 Tax=Apatococcus lobatus TaxID=904363 RepID=A0AAW1SBU8_9CHLO
MTSGDSPAEGFDLKEMASAASGPAAGPRDPTESAWDPGSSGSADPEVPWVGVPGQVFVQRFLSRMDPKTAVAKIQQQGGLMHPGCGPLLGLLDALGCTRLEAHKGILEAASTALLARIATLDTDKLLDLLEASFPLVGISALRAIPLAILARLQPVPISYLKQLADDKDLFQDLPRGVQRQVWEREKSLLQQHAIPCMSSFVHASLSKVNLDMDECLPASKPVLVKSAPLPVHAGVNRRKLRGGNKQLKILVDMVGPSEPIYRGIMELCMLKFRDSDKPYVGQQEADLCSLRSQLLMSLHDISAVEICNQEACYRLAWVLDAGMEKRLLSESHLSELQRFFAPLDNTQHTRRGAKAGSKRSWSKRGTDDDDAESQGGSGTHQQQVLGDAGMILRDSPVFHLIIHQVIRRLEAVTEKQETPATDQTLAFLTRLLQLATGCRTMLREKQFSFPAVSPHLMHDFYPLLTGCVLDSLVREDEPLPGLQEVTADPDLVGMLTREELVRKVTQVYTLERLAVQDVATALPLLLALAQALSQLSDKALPEWTPFAFSLAARLQEEHRSNRLTPGDTLWQIAVEQLLLPSVDSDHVVHDQTLQLLKACALQLTVAKLAAYLQTTLANSRKSRRRYKKRRAEGLDTPSHAYDSSGPFSDGTYAGELDMTGDRERKGKAEGDGVKNVYKEIQSLVPALNDTTAPGLMEYLAAG